MPATRKRMSPSTTPLASMAGAFVRGSVVMTILPREGSIAPPAEHDDTPDHASVAEAAGQPAFESPPKRSSEPEEHGHDRGQDQRLGGTHPAGLYPLPEAEPTVHAGARTGAARAPASTLRSRRGWDSTSSTRCSYGSRTGGSSARRSRRRQRWLCKRHRRRRSSSAAQHRD